MFVNSYDPSALFRGEMWHEFAEDRKEKAIDEMRKIDPVIFESNTLEEIKQNFRDKYLIERIVLLEDSKTKEIIEEDLDYYDDMAEAIGYDGHIKIPGYKVIIHIPFTGDEKLFRVTPSVCSMSYRKGDVLGNVLSTSLQFYERDVDDEGKRIDSDIGKLMDSLKTEITRINNDVDSFNKEFAQEIDKHIDLRLSKIKKMQSIKTALKIPIEPSSGPSPLNKISIAIKKFAPLSTKSSNADGAYVSNEDYEAILETIRSCGQSLEVNTAAKGRGEEEIRDIFLTCLGASIKPGAGFAGGELFHVNGKTDIAIPFENKATFIAECKLWKGEKYIDDGIDQLMNYASWRDVKVALLIFNIDNKNFSSIQDKISSIFKNRSDFIKEIVQREGEWRFVLQKSDDDYRQITFHVFAFDLKR